MALAIRDGYEWQKKFTVIYEYTQLIALSTFLFDINGGTKL